MRILFLAPQPFFQERGTPIAVRLALEVLSNRAPTPPLLDLVTYHEGADITIPGVSLHRMRIPAFLKSPLSQIRPGISLKKLVCDLFFTWTTITLLWRNRGEKYDLIHAVEESVFIALLVKWVLGIPYLYDMDSSLSLQVTDSWRLLRWARPLLSTLERLAMRHSAAVVPVCDALAALAENAGCQRTFVLRDISLLDAQGGDGGSLRAELGLPSSSSLILYVGNLERYQGLELACRGFSTIAASHPDTHLIVVGGTPGHIADYTRLLATLPHGNRIHLVGPRPVSQLYSLISQSNVLLSPRILGNNTPMKIYSYLHSGKPIVATRIPSHTQVLTDTVAALAEPEPAAFGAVLSRVLSDRSYATSLGEEARNLAEKEYTFPIFEKRLNSLYDSIGKTTASGK
jgi:glycosyltransferase involved in cell wall biosynthesis